MVPNSLSKVLMKGSVCLPQPCEDEQQAARSLLQASRSLLQVYRALFSSLFLKRLEEVAATPGYSSGSLDLSTGLTRHHQRPQAVLSYYK